MTMATASPTGMTSNTATEPGFGATLQSEWTKLRSLRSTWIIVSLAIGLSIGFSALIALTSGLTHDSWNDTVRSQFDPVLTTNSGSLFGCILLIMLGVTAVTSEYSSRMIRTTFIGNPRRLQVFAAKTTVVALLGLVITAISIPGMFLVSQPIFGHYGLETASIVDSETYSTLIRIILTQMLNYALIPFAIAWLLRGGASAITVSLGFLWLPWILGPVLPLWVKENVLRYLPDVAANSLSGINKADTAQYLGQTPAIIVIAIWLIGLLATAAFVLNRRDV
ncbi:MAG: ABC transporter permease [Chloroflexota bacterium]|nr:ABC transporter permease [Chloroflexota bacterium]